MVSTFGVTQDAVHSLCSHCPGDGRLLLHSDCGRCGAEGGGTCGDCAGRSALDLDERAAAVLNAKKSDGDADGGEQVHGAAAGSDREQMFRIFRVPQRCRRMRHRIIL